MIENNLLTNKNITNQKIWLHKLTGAKYKSTRNELNIANGLTANKAKRYLETRAILRNSISNLYALDPMHIPIKSIPNKPIELPPGMGSINISHCSDALIIAWCSKRIGIDIERKDRQFNYVDFEHIYLNNRREKKYNKLNQLEVLNRWCGIEAAIKWDEGNLASDIVNWDYNFSQNYILNNKKKLRLEVNQFYFLDWTISIALRDSDIKFTPMICY